MYLLVLSVHQYYTYEKGARFCSEYKLMECFKQIKVLGWESAGNGGVRSFLGG